MHARQAIDPFENLGPHLLQLVRTDMPFGKYQGRKIADLPEAYLIWFAQKGFPSGQLGTLMGLMLEIRQNGLEHLLQPLRKNHG